jgi:hypothetical protein
MRLIFLAAVIFIGSGCSAMQSYEDKIESVVRKYFPDENVRKKVFCLFLVDGKNVKSCNITHTDLAYKKDNIESNPNISDIAIAQYSEDKSSKYRITPEKVEYLLKIDHHSRSWVESIIIGYPLSYYKALIKAAGSPNGFANTEHYSGSIMHLTIEFWDDDKVNYMLNAGVNLEQRDDFRGETAILVARRSDKTQSEYTNIIKLLAHGADPTALDKDGNGLCHFLDKNKSRWDSKYPNAKEELRLKLRNNYNMDC